VINAVVRRLDAVPPIEAQAPPRWKQAPATDWPSRTRWTVRTRCARFVVAATCVGIAGIAVLGLPGSSSVDQAKAALPVFERPAVDATRLRPATPVLARREANYTDARAIATPGGPGYVVPAADGGVCLAVPDGGEGYGESCADAEQIAQRGLVVVLTSRDRGTMAAVVPETASNATLHLPDGSEKRLDIVDGVITATAAGKAGVTFRLGAHIVSVPLHYALACVQVDKGDPTPTEDDKRAVRNAGMRFCRPAD
jgi:hypothetical protein